MKAHGPAGGVIWFTLVSILISAISLIVWLIKQSFAANAKQIEDLRAENNKLRDRLQWFYERFGGGNDHSNTAS